MLRYFSLDIICSSVFFELRPGNSLLGRDMSADKYPSIFPNGRYCLYTMYSMYSYVTRMNSCITRMFSYVTRMHSCVTRMYSYVLE